MQRVGGLWYLVEGDRRTAGNERSHQREDHLLDTHRRAPPLNTPHSTTHIQPLQPYNRSETLYSRSRNHRFISRVGKRTVLLLFLPDRWKKPGRNWKKPGFFQVFSTCVLDMFLPGFFHGFFQVFSSSHVICTVHINFE